MHVMTIFHLHICGVVTVFATSWLSAVAQGLTERIQGTSVFLFGWADAPLHRGLAQRRKEMGWFKKKVLDLQAIRPDVGSQPIRRFGVTGEPHLAWTKSKQRLGLIIVLKKLTEKFTVQIQIIVKGYFKILDLIYK